MSKTAKLFLLGSVFVFVLAIPLFLILSNENHLGNTEYQFKFRQLYPKDPYDPIRGKYITLRFFQNNVPLEKDSLVLVGENVNVVVERDSLGWAYFKYAQKETPDVANYFTTRVNYFWDGFVSIDIPFERYYMNEELAPAAETEYNRLARERDTNLFLIVTVKDGKALSNDLYYKDELYIEYLRKLK